MGTAFTSQHANVLKRYTDQVILTYDSDGAGVKAALRAIPILKEVGMSIKVLNMKPYKDPDEFIKNMGAEASGSGSRKPKQLSLKWMYCGGDMRWMIRSRRPGSTRRRPGSFSSLERP